LEKSFALMDEWLYYVVKNNLKKIEFENKRNNDIVLIDNKINYNLENNNSNEKGIQNNLNYNNE